jgi:hypothetical protein
VCVFLPLLYNCVLLQEWNLTKKRQHEALKKDERGNFLNPGQAEAARALIVEIRQLKGELSAYEGYARMAGYQAKRYLHVVRPHECCLYDMLYPFDETPAAGAPARGGKSEAGLLKHLLGMVLWTIHLHHWTAGQMPAFIPNSERHLYNRLWKPWVKGEWQLSKMHLHQCQRAPCLYWWWVK